MLSHRERKKRGMKEQETEEMKRDRGGKEKKKEQRKEGTPNSAADTEETKARK